MRARTILCTALAAALWSPGAQATQDELILAFEPGYDRISREQASQNGLGATMSAWLGLTDALWLSLSGGAFQTLDEDADRERFLRWEAFGGLVAAFDVFRVVPYLEVSAGVVGARGSLFPTIRFGGGADYLFTPKWSAGAIVRYRPLPEEDIGSASVTAQLRLAYRFDW